MKRESRIIISNLSESDAIKLLPELKREPLAEKAKFELDNPEPPDLLEREYERVNNALSDCNDSLDRSPEWYGAQKKSQVAKDVIGIRKWMDKFLDGPWHRLSEAVCKLEDAADKL